MCMVAFKKTAVGWFVIVALLLAGWMDPAFALTSAWPQCDTITKPLTSSANQLGCANPVDGVCLTIGKDCTDSGTSSCACGEAGVSSSCLPSASDKDVRTCQCTVTGLEFEPYPATIAQGGCGPWVESSQDAGCMTRRCAGNRCQISKIKNISSF